MNTFNCKALAAFTPALPVAAFIAACLAFGSCKTEVPADEPAPYADADVNKQESAKISGIFTSINKEIDSIRHLPVPAFSGSFYNDTMSGTEQKALSATSQPVQHEEDTAVQHTAKGIDNKDDLQESPGVFSCTYTLAIGKALPVTVMQSSHPGLAPAQVQLVTITLNDVADDKAGFTIADSSAVLLFSGASYAVDDKIIIEDGGRHIHINVVQVNDESVVIDFTSSLNQDIANTLHSTE